MAERKPRATKEESLKAKIESNLEAQAKLIAKVEALKLAEKALRQELADLKHELVAAQMKLEAAAH